MQIKINSVLIADEIEQECLDQLKTANINVLKKTKLNEQNLITELKNHEAVIVRSATQVSFYKKLIPLRFFVFTELISLKLFVISPFKILSFFIEKFWISFYKL